MQSDCTLVHKIFTMEQVPFSAVVSVSHCHTVQSRLTALDALCSSAELLAPLRTEVGAEGGVSAGELPLPISSLIT